MKFSTSLRSAILAPILALSVSAGPLDAYRGVNRLIVVSLPEGSSPEKVAAALVTGRGKINERDLKVIDVSEGAHRVPTALRLSPEQTNSLRKQLKIVAGDTRPVFILIGKDGGEKARQHGTLDLEKWFVLIDGMPMRRQEIQRQPDKSH